MKSHALQNAKIKTEILQPLAPLWFNEKGRAARHVTAERIDPLVTQTLYLIHHQ